VNTEILADRVHKIWTIMPYGLRFRQVGAIHELPLPVETSSLKHFVQNQPAKIR
jgi:hypothetical protein